MSRGAILKGRTERKCALERSAALSFTGIIENGPARRLEDISGETNQPPKRDLQLPKLEIKGAYEKKEVVLWYGLQLTRELVNLVMHRGSNQFLVPPPK